MVNSKDILIASIGVAGIYTILSIGVFGKNLSLKNATLAVTTVATNSIIGMYCVSK